MNQRTGAGGAIGRVAALRGRGLAVLLLLVGLLALMAVPAGGASAGSFARAISVTTVQSRVLTRVVVVALTVMAVSRFVPLAAAQLYAQGVAGIVALWPLAYAMRTQPRTQTAGRRRPIPTS